MAEELYVIDDRDRYSRMRLISWWRQEKVRAARVLVVGAGALGNEVLKNLALVGLGTIVVVDFDEIESSNLTRSMFYRRDDEGRSKAEVAARRIREMNPDVRAIGIHADIRKVGLGLFRDVDVVIGCLDNREARLWVNRQCWKANKPWVDSAIQELMGVVRIFVPPSSACFECGMSEMDYKLINVRYSCPGLRRDQIAEGKTPTTPTIASIAGGLETQEALKIIHDMPVQEGTAYVFHGQNNHFYATRLPRKEECLSHLTYREMIPIPLGNGAKGRELLDAARDHLGAAEQARIMLDRELIVRLMCRTCSKDRPLEPPLLQMDASVRQAACPDCGALMAAEMTHQVEETSPLAALSLGELGIPPYDAVRIVAGNQSAAFVLEGDKARIWG